MMLFAKDKPQKWNSHYISYLQMEAIALLVYNYIIALVLAHQEIEWQYEFEGIETSKRYGIELIEPAVVTQFGFVFRLITIIMNTLVVIPIIAPRRKYRPALLPPIIWNVYTITTVTENLVELIWTMYMLVVPQHVFITIGIVGTFMLSLQCKLTLQLLRFYELLNYIK